MSEDEYCDEYDDFEEALWDADPAPDLADDLAEHAAYSPVWQNDPVGELEPYHSDWEYYSDDYYDDDPLLEQNSLDGGPVQPKTRLKAGNLNKGKKRKLQEAREVLTVGGKGSLLASIKGTVWAQDESRGSDVFYKGQQEKVALLRNWKELFNKDGSTRTFGRGQLQRDESWANNMSLADMGLLNERDKTNVQAEPPQEAGLSHDEERGIDIDNSEQDKEEGISSEANGKSSVLPVEIGGYQSDEAHDDRIDDDNPEPDIHSRKRRRSPRLPFAPLSNESTFSGQDSHEDKTPEPDGGRKRLKRSTKYSSEHTVNPTAEADADAIKGKLSKQPHARESRKRKADAVSDDIREHEVLHEQRNKRVTSSKPKQDSQLGDRRPSPLPKVI